MIETHLPDELITELKPHFGNDFSLWPICDYGCKADDLPNPYLQYKPRTTGRVDGKGADDAANMELTLTFRQPSGERLFFCLDRQLHFGQTIDDIKECLPRQGAP